MDVTKIAITGIRPQKLKTGYHYDTPMNRMIICFIAKIIKQEAADSDIELYVGGALGIDQMAYLAGRLLRGNGRNVRIILCIPYKNQPNMWKDNKILQLYQEMKDVCDEVVYVDTVDGYIKCDTPEGEHSNIKLQMRNIYMVNKADVVIGFNNGTTGGTHNCMKYATSIGKKLVDIRIDKFVDDMTNMITAGSKYTS